MPPQSIPLAPSCTRKRSHNLDENKAERPSDRTQDDDRCPLPPSRPPSPVVGVHELKVEVPPLEEDPELHEPVHFAIPKALVGARAADEVDDDDDDMMQLTPVMSPQEQQKQKQARVDGRPPCSPAASPCGNDPYGVRFLALKVQLARVLVPRPLVPPPAVTPLVPIATCTRPVIRPTARPLVRCRPRKRSMPVMVEVRS